MVLNISAAITRLTYYLFQSTETALSAGYRFKARNPEPDPRYPADHQLMVGPIPGESISLLALKVQFHKSFVSTNEPLFPLLELFTWV